MRIVLVDEVYVVIPQRQLDCLHAPVNQDNFSLRNLVAGIGSRLDRYAGDGIYPLSRSESVEAMKEQKHKNNTEIV